MCLVNWWEYADLSFQLRMATSLVCVCVGARVHVCVWEKLSITAHGDQLSLILTPKPTRSTLTSPWSAWLAFPTRAPSQAAIYRRCDRPSEETFLAFQTGAFERVSPGSASEPSKFSGFVFSHAETNVHCDTVKPGLMHYSHNLVELQSTKAASSSQRYIERRRLKSGSRVQESMRRLHVSWGTSSWFVPSADQWPLFLFWELPTCALRCNTSIFHQLFCLIHLHLNR